MSQQERKDTGIPTRAIHESYLNLQQTHRQFRQANDDPEVDASRHHAAFQDAVLTFYELIRPHLKHESGLSEYWEGEVPDYAGWNFNSAPEAAAYIRDHGTGIYQVQEHAEMRSYDQEVLTDGGELGFDQWHELLGLSWQSERLVAVSEVPDREDAADAGTGQCIVKLLRIAVLSLRELDHWQSYVTKERTRGDGFMAGETSVSTDVQFEPVVKLITGKRLLVEAADDLGLLSEVEAGRPETEITKEDIQKVETWRQKQIQ